MVDLAKNFGLLHPPPPSLPPHHQGTEYSREWHFLLPPPPPPFCPTPPASRGERRHSRKKNSFRLSSYLLNPHVDGRRKHLPKKKRLSSTSGTESICLSSEAQGWSNLRRRGWGGVQSDKRERESEAGRTLDLLGGAGGS